MAGQVVLRHARGIISIRNFAWKIPPDGKELEPILHLPLHVMEKQPKPEFKIVYRSIL